VVVPESGADDVIDDLTRRRGTFRQAEAGDVARAAPGMHVIEARVPLAEMLGYADRLRSQTNGRSTCSMSFDGYDPVEGQSDLGDGDSFVGAPRKPVLPRNQLAIESPEPDDDRY
jgi:translation elongation factor EF-G